MRKLAVALLFASTVFGQDLSRTFPLKNISAGPGIQELATTLRTVFDVTQLTIDPAIPSITITGSSAQVALAEWLVPKLDSVQGAISASQKYFVAGNSNDVAEIVPIKNAAYVTNLQEQLTTLRTVADIQKIYQLSSPRFLVLRSDPGHVALADFLISQLDQPAAPRNSATIQSFQPVLPGNQRGNNDPVITYGLANVQSTVQLQVIITALRTVLNVQKIYQYTATNTLAIRADPERMQVVEWLLPKIDASQPVTGNNQMQYPGGNDDVIKVFYVPPATDLSALVKAVHSKIPLVYQSLTPPALVVRSTADQMAIADNLIGAQ
jgi:type II secretory pathway component GspD/PulD (secretin)